MPSPGTDRPRRPGGCSDPGRRGTIAQAVSSVARSSGAAATAGSDPTSRTSSVPRSAGTSSITTSARACGSSWTSRTSIRPSGPRSSIRRCAYSRSRLAMLMNTDRVTADGDGPYRQRDDRLVPVGSARPPATLIGASTVPVSGVARAPSVATRICASPERAASLPASSSASPRLPLRCWAGSRRAPGGRAPGQSSR